jgi:hypothetical protein
MNPARGAAVKKRRTFLTVTLFIFLLLSAVLVVIFTIDRQSSNPPRIVFRSVSEAGDGSRHATFEIINTSKSEIYHFGYVRIEGPGIVRQLIDRPLPSKTISARGNAILILPLPTNALGDLSVRFYGSRPLTPVQETAEAAGELLEKLGLQPDRLKAFYDHSANTWEIDSSFSIPPKP